MANEEHLARLQQGVKAWNEWRLAHRDIKLDLTSANFEMDRYRDIKPDLSRANLTGMDLDGVDLRGTDLREATLSGAGLIKAILTGADLTQATLYRANLRGAHLDEAHLTDAILSEADLTAASLQGTYLIRTDLYRATLNSARLPKAILIRTILKRVILDEAHIGWTTFGGVDLSEVQGLDTVEHYGPSTIGIDTLFRSQGKIPEVFLRGAGVPNVMITYSKSLVGRPFEFYTCFISYSSKDQEFAERLHSDLQNHGVRCWFAPEDVQGGRKLHEQIDQAIRVHERLLLILSSHSMNSEWVKTEITKTRQREVQEHRQVLFPVLLVPFEAIQTWECFDADTGKDAAREIREYFIPDFSNWKGYDSYQKAFQRLLRDLKPNATPL